MAHETFHKIFPAKQYMFPVPCGHKGSDNYTYRHMYTRQPTDVM